VVVLEKRADAERGTLTRRITAFRRVGEHYRRDDGVHRLRLYGASENAEGLRWMGFRVRTLRGYGRYRLARAYAAFVARKPA
jgi:hypothetical protein